MRRRRQVMTRREAQLTWLAPALLPLITLLQQLTDRLQHLLHLPKRLPQAATAAAPASACCQCCRLRQISLAAGKLAQLGEGAAGCGGNCLL